MHALGHVPPVHDDELEHSTPGSERTELDAVHDSPGYSNEDDDSDPHPDCHAGGTRRLGREEHKRGMIAGERTRRRRRRDGDGGRSTRSEHEPLRLQV